MAGKSLSKMQIRAVLMSILNKYRHTSTVSAAEFKVDVDKINEIEDKAFVCHTLFKEMINPKLSYTNTCAILALETIPKDIFEKQAMDYIQDGKNDDELKFFMVSLLKQKGIPVNYNYIFEYIKEPDKIAQNGVKDFLLNAIEDPEVQIDFLDFYLNITKREKLYLLGNLIEEAQGDDLANALSLLCQVNIDDDELQYVIDGLIKSNSCFAIDGFNYLIENRRLEKTDYDEIKKALKKLNFKYRNWKNTKLVENSDIYKCYIGFVDGKADFSLIISRLRKDNLIDTMLVTINVTDGIKACMGFGKIPVNNFHTIVKRLYMEVMPIEITPVALKALVKFFHDKNIKNNIDVPYEFIVWKKLLADIRDINYDVSELIMSKLNSVNLNDEKIKKILTAKILEPWYFSIGQTKNSDKLIEEVDNTPDKSFKNIQSIIQKAMTRDFINNDSFLSTLKNMLLIQSYAAFLARLQMSSSYTYSLCFDIKHLSKLVESMLDKTIYYHLSSLLYVEEDKLKNVFKTKSKTKFTKDELEDLLDKFEEKWS